MSDAWWSQDLRRRGRACLCRCGRSIFFDGSDCRGCGAPLGYDPLLGRISALEIGPDEGTWRRPDQDMTSLVYRRCRSFETLARCDWLLPVEDELPYCRCCRLNRTIADLGDADTRVGKFALIQHQRYAHAKQFKRANRMLKKLRTYLGRVIRDIGRKIEGNRGLEGTFAQLLLLARRVREQKQHQRGRKVYSLHAPEVECIGKGKAHRPYEFGVKVSVATTLKHCKGGQFVTHVKALPGNPYDGHTLATVIPDMEALVGNTIARILADKGYRGHNAPPDYKFRVFIAGQKRGVTPKIKRELRRRSAVEPVIGHLKAEHRMGRNYLWFRRGDANNVVLAAAGYNFRRLIRWPGFCCAKSWPLSAPDL
jgi:hypothetical protein